MTRRTCSLNGNHLRALYKYGHVLRKSALHGSAPWSSMLTTNECANVAGMVLDFAGVLDRHIRPTRRFILGTALLDWDGIRGVTLVLSHSSSDRSRCCNRCWKDKPWNLSEYFLFGYPGFEHWEAWERGLQSSSVAKVGDVALRSITVTFSQSRRMHEVPADLPGQLLGKRAGGSLPNALCSSVNVGDSQRSSSTTLSERDAGVAPRVVHCEAQAVESADMVLFP